MELGQEVLAHVGEAMQEVEAGLREALDDASPYSREVIMHLAESGGKRVRPLLSLLSAQVVGRRSRAGPSRWASPRR